MKAQRPYRRAGRQGTRARRREGSARQPRRRSGRAGEAALRLLQDPARRRGAEGAGRGEEAPDRAVVDQAKARSPTSRRAAARRTRRATKATSKVATAEPTTAAKAAERFWLQAGSFASEADAENLKARLAFAGWEASDPAGHAAGQGRALSRAPRPLRQHRRAQPDEERAREARLRRRGDQILSDVDRPELAPRRGTQ